MTFKIGFLYVALILLLFMFFAVHIASYVMPTISDYGLTLLKHIVFVSFFGSIAYLMLLTRIKIKSAELSIIKRLCAIESFLTIMFFVGIIYLIVYNRQFPESKVENGLYFVSNGKDIWLNCDRLQFQIAAWLSIRNYSALNIIGALMSIIVVFRKHLGVFRDSKHASLP